MIFIFGPLYNGKHAVAAKILNCDENELYKYSVVWDVQEQAARIGYNTRDLKNLSERLTQYEIVIATETGGGVIPVEKSEREAREAAGYLNRLLAEKADVIIRVFCGIPVVLRGNIANMANMLKIADNINNISDLERIE